MARFFNKARGFSAGFYFGGRMTRDSQQKIVGLLEKAEKDGFYGDIVFSFRNGDIYLIRKSQSLKLEDLPDDA